eukprot:gene14654-biopygen20117
MVNRHVPLSTCALLQYICCNGGGQPDLGRASRHRMHTGQAWAHTRLTSTTITRPAPRLRAPRRRTVCAGAFHVFSKGVLALGGL